MRKGLFYTTYAGEPYYNMAFDEWLFGRAIDQPGTCFLRIYSWQPGAITFGLNQREQSALDFSKTGETAVIRRITGGRALFHDCGEITYSIAISEDSGHCDSAGKAPWVASELIAKSLVQFLRQSGIEAQYAAASVPRRASSDFFHKAPCFASTARHEVIGPGGKIVASAQRRIGSTFLQHGSIKRHGIATHQALNVKDLAASAAEPTVLSRQEFDEAASQLRAAFGAALGHDFVEQTLEESQVSELSEVREHLFRNGLSRRDIIKRR